MVLALTAWYVLGDNGGQVWAVLDNSNLLTGPKPGQWIVEFMLNP